MTRRVMRIPTPSPPLVTPGGTAVSDSEKAEALADSLESQFQPVNDPSDPAVIEKATEVLQAYFYAPASEPRLTNPVVVQDAIRGLKLRKAPGPNGLPNRALKHLRQRAISLLNAALVAQYNSQAAIQPKSPPQIGILCAPRAVAFSIPSPGRESGL
jgi:hypothetical protein